MNHDDMADYLILNPDENARLIQKYKDENQDKILEFRQNMIDCFRELPKYELEERILQYQQYGYSAWLDRALEIYNERFN